MPSGTLSYKNTLLMEMIMSMTLTAAPREGVGGNIFQALGGAFKRWWVAYIAWRMEQAAIAHLNAMSDRELKDIGLIRSDIRRRVASCISVPYPTS